MTRADDLRADLVQNINAYILDNLDPGLTEEEDEAIHEAGDIVDFVLQAVYERTMADLSEVLAAIHQIYTAPRHADGRLACPEPEPTQQAWWETWPATHLVHQQERYAGTAADPDAVPAFAISRTPKEAAAFRERVEDGGPRCVCTSDDLYCEVHDA